MQARERKREGGKGLIYQLIHLTVYLDKPSSFSLSLPLSLSLSLSLFLSLAHALYLPSYPYRNLGLGGLGVGPYSHVMAVG